MGAEIAKCLTGPIQRRDGYLETKDGIVTWGFGHILRQAEPEEYDARYHEPGHGFDHSGLVLKTISHRGELTPKRLSGVL